MLDRVAMAAQRLRRESGQTAAEYLGIVVVVAVIIGVLATTDIGTEIRDGVLQMIQDILGSGG
ncbi:MAG: hypothetical protein GEU81_01655 [Nitriliruptorales bacterium]|nr:hypothetical protein [Nitriliruptorales bacterium]